LTFAAAGGKTLADEFVQALGDMLVSDQAGKYFLVFRVTSSFGATLNDFSLLQPIYLIVH
jgi:hypothetical protein